MTPISYDYIKEYMTKWEHSLAWYDVAINSTIKTCIQLYKFWIGVYVKLDGLMEKALDLRIRGREFESWKWVGWALEPQINHTGWMTVFPQADRP